MMKHAIIAACGAVAVAGTMTLSAQTQPRPTPRPSASTPSRTDEKTMTVTGCLKAWDAAAGAPATETPAPGATTPGAPASRFVLTNVEPEAKSAPSEGAPSRTGSGGTMGTKQYVLTPDNGVNLAAHLNHKVRITGKAITNTEHSAAGATRPTEPTRPGEVPAPTPADPGRTTDRNDMAKAWTTLAVSSVTMVSASCAGATN